jgi:carbon-monoxide dehydrogenase medium subunit
MRPAKFEYFDPRTIDEALDLLGKYGEEAKVLAGGLSLLPLMRFRLATPGYIVDISKIPGLSHIVERTEGGLRIGALTPYFTIETSNLVRSSCPVVAETAANIGDPQVRNRGTIGGNLCHADPAGDYGPVMRSLDAELKMVGLKGERVLSAADFLIDMYTPALKPDELLTEIMVARMPKRTGQSYLKLNYKTGATPIVSAAVVMTLEDGDVCKAVRVVLGAVGAVAIEAEETEQALLGKAVTDRLINDAADLAANSIEPVADFHASADYRSAMAKVVTRRALNEAFAKARGAH